VAAEPFVLASPFLLGCSSFNPNLLNLTHWFHLARLALGVARWQAKGNQNQMEGPPGSWPLQPLRKPPLVPLQELLVPVDGVNQARRVWSAHRALTCSSREAGEARPCYRSLPDFWGCRLLTKKDTSGKNTWSEEEEEEEDRKGKEEGGTASALCQ